MTRSLGTAVAVVALLAAACDGGSSAGSASGASPPASSGGRPMAGDVPLTTTGRLARAWENGGLRFGPPPNAAPELDAAGAVTASRNHSGRAPTGAREVSAVYATLTLGRHEGVPVWLVTYTGDICIPITGGGLLGGPTKPRSTAEVSPPGSTGSMVPRDCYHSPVITIVNATTGHRIMSYADGHTDPGTMISP